MGTYLRVGEWRVDPESGHIAGSNCESRIKPLLLKLLLFLTDNAGQVVSKKRIIAEVWRGVHVTEDALTHSISELRKAFDDSARDSRIIATIPKRGYRLIAPVSRESKNERGPSAPLRYAVLPFENLSEDSVAQRFANIMTDLVTTHLAKNEGIRVISKISMAGFDKVTAEAVRELHADRILEGTVLHAEGRIGMTMRLFSQEYEYLWAEVYEQDSHDFSALQDLAKKIAAAVVTGHRR